MKKIWIITFIIIIGLIASITAVYMYTINHTQGFKNNTEKTLAGENRIENITNKNMIVTTSSEEEKLSPNAQLVFEKQYKGCGHVVKEKTDITNEMVNMKKGEFEKAYSDWKIEKFMSSQIILSKKLEGSCGKHYILKDKDGYIAIYTIDETGIETIKEMTEISTKYLPETDLISLKTGIKANGEEDLNKILENFE